MNCETGDLILKELKVDKGVYHGQLPEIFVGRVRLPWNRQVGVANSMHQYLIQGLNEDGVTCYICACGEGFLGFAQAYDHFFQNCRSTASDGNGKDGEAGDVIISKANDMEVNVAKVNLQSQVEATINQPQSNVSYYAIQEDGVEGVVPGTMKNYKQNPPKLLIEAIIAKHGLKMDGKYKLYCATELDISIYTFYMYFRSIEGRIISNKNNQFVFNQTVMDEAEQIHLKVLSYIANSTNPCNKLDETKEGTIVRYLCGKRGALISEYRNLLASKLEIETTRIDELFKSAVVLKNLNRYMHTVPKFLKLKANELDEAVMSELKQDLTLPCALKTSIKLIPEKKLIMEVIWEKYGLDFGIKYKRKCAEELQINVRKMVSWWAHRKLFSDTFKGKSRYTRLITNAIRDRAEKLHMTVMESLGGSIQREKRSLPKYSFRNTLIYQAILQNPRAKFSREFRLHCAAKLGIKKSTAIVYWMQARIRFNRGIEYPHQHLISENIRNESMKIQLEVKAELGNKENNN